MPLETVKDHFGNIETEFLMKSYSKVRHEMMCEYVEVSANQDKGMIDQMFLVLLGIID